MCWANRGRGCTLQVHSHVPGCQLCNGSVRLHLARARAGGVGLVSRALCTRCVLLPQLLSPGAVPASQRSVSVSVSVSKRSLTVSSVVLPPRLYLHSILARVALLSPRLCTCSAC